jgi:hypothetical protein
MWALLVGATGWVNYRAKQLSASLFDVIFVAYFELLVFGLNYRLIIQSAM